MIHRIYNDPNSALPELNRTIEEHVRPEEATFEQARHQVEELESAFELEENKQETQRRNRRLKLRDIVLEGAPPEDNKQIEVPAQPTETGEQLIAETGDEKPYKFDFKGDEKVDKISSMNPVNDFNQMINDRETDRVEDALTQMKSIILELIKNSIQGDVYEKAIDCLKAMRKACKDNDEPDSFNSYLTQLKSKFENTTNADFYELIRQNQISLITKDESFKSKVTKDEANSFLGITEITHEQNENENGKKDEPEQSFFDDIE